MIIFLNERGVHVYMVRGILNERTYVKVKFYIEAKNTCTVSKLLNIGNMVYLSNAQKQQGTNSFIQKIFIELRFVLGIMLVLGGMSLKNISYTTC